MAHVPGSGQERSPREHPFAVDVHTHIATPGIVDGLERGRWHGIGLERRSDGHVESVTAVSRQPLPWPDVREGIDGRIARMDAWGIDVQVVSLSPTLWRYEVDAADAAAAAREVNDDLAAIVERHPDRFRAFAHLPMTDPGAAVTELRRAMGMPGFVGAAVGTHVNGVDWDAPSLFPVLEAAQESGALLMLHPSSVRFNPFLPRYHLRNLIGNPAETTVAIAALIFGGVLDRLPDLHVLVVHGGGYAIAAAGRLEHGQRVRPEARGAREPATGYLRRLYFDSLTHSEAGLRYLIDVVGADHVVLGSDDPADMGRADPARWVWGLTTLTEDERRAVSSGTISDLLGPPLARGPRAMPAVIAGR
jgi:aminocarboxymuconate-semialdehyde decarboxylase